MPGAIRRRSTASPSRSACRGRARSDQLRRVTDDDLRTTIANYEEVAAAIGSSRWAPLLEE